MASFTNRWLWGAIALSLAAAGRGGLRAVPAEAFSTVGLECDWLRCAAVASSVLWLRELSKLITRAEGIEACTRSERSTPRRKDISRKIRLTARVHTALQSDRSFALRKQRPQSRCGETIRPLGAGSILIRGSKCRRARCANNAVSANPIIDPIRRSAPQVEAPKPSSPAEAARKSAIGKPLALRIAPPTLKRIFALVDFSNFSNRALQYGVTLPNNSTPVSCFSTSSRRPYRLHAPHQIGQVGKRMASRQTDTRLRELFGEISC